ncbi:MULTISPECIES: DUF2061 domain-containing protein [unclassified Meridianimarinicoccus]|uniref:DUF2061 domain-containing protein n=1 Tax=unclassified Meridianimarinicoccus TaxID=2923344 RepID=UPI00299F877F|nr:DUF2061 domain-containing protein [Fluviibacterium sp. MJW13]
MSDTPLRTLAKTLTWQGLGLLSMTLIGLAITGSVAAGGTIALIGAGVGTVCYVLHERLWARVRWGRSEAGSQPCNIAPISSRSA